LNIDQKNLENSELSLFEKEIKISGLEFSYFPSNIIFKDINVTIKKKQKIIFFGDSGVGKSTLIDLIIGILSPNKGSIVIDNKYSPNLNLSWLKLISYVPQKSYIHNNSLKFNITFKNDDNLIDKELYKLALKISGLDEILKKGLDENKNIGEFGSNLSGGQRQRVSLARAIYKNAPIIIIDEQTNALDIDSEKKILDKLLELKSKTIIFITHRNDNISNFDKFYKLENNRVIEVKKNEIENI
jgi:ABC-type bacteriocin/lantibiotic exporter with double-glycine peptidase domain